MKMQRLLQALIERRSRHALPLKRRSVSSEQVEQICLEALEQRKLMSSYMPTGYSDDPIRVQPEYATVTSMDAATTSIAASIETVTGSRLSQSITSDQTEIALSAMNVAFGPEAKVDEGAGGSNPGWIQYVDGVVGIYGTPYADTVSVSYVGGNLPGVPPSSMVLISLRNNLGSQLKAYYWPTIQEIQFFGFAGADSFTNTSSINSMAEGGDGDDTLTGGFGDDDLRGGSGLDTLIGNNGNDYLYGGNRNDVLEGGSGHDILSGGNGADVLKGGHGNDTLSGGYGHDWIFGNDGIDTLHGDSGNDYIDGGSGYDTIRGGSGNDRLFGGSETDFIYGDSGNDELRGGTDADYIRGGSGDDHIYGGSGNDVLYGYSGNDHIEGDTGDDILYGHDGNDYLAGEAGNDTLYGHDGNDHIVGGAGDDTLYGNNGHDDLYGGDDRDDLYGGAGRDGLYGGRGWNTLQGGSGPDRFLTRDVVGGIGLSYLDDVQSNDAILRFVSGDKDWSESEIEKVDEVFRILHDRTADTKLLKTHTGDEITYERQVSHPKYAAINTGPADDKVIIYTDDAFGNQTWITRVTIHELAHNWDSQSENNIVNTFRSYSGWTQNPPDNGFWWVERDNGWYFNAFNERFASEYGSTAPYEDFAEVMSAVLMDELGMTFWETDGSAVAAGLPAVPQKAALVLNWINSL